jgi:hypothetical protein
MDRWEKTAWLRVNYPALPLASLALEDGGSALPLAETDHEAAEDEAESER